MHSNPMIRRPQQLPSIRSIPSLAAHLPPLSVTSPASSIRTVSSMTTSDDSGTGQTDETMTTESSEEEEEDEEKPPTRVEVVKKTSSRLGRKLPNKACGPCKKHHTECGPVRPCPMCVRRNRAHLCVDVPSKRGQKARQRNSHLATVAASNRPPLTRSPPQPQPQPIHLTPLPFRRPSPLFSLVKQPHKTSTPLRHPLFRRTVTYPPALPSPSPLPPLPLPPPSFSLMPQQHPPLIASSVSRPSRPSPSVQVTSLQQAHALAGWFRPSSSTPRLTIRPSSFSSPTAPAPPAPNPSLRPHLDLLHRRTSDNIPGVSNLRSTAASATTAVSCSMPLDRPMEQHWARERVV